MSSLRIINRQCSFNIKQHKPLMPAYKKTNIQWYGTKDKELTVDGLKIETKRGVRTIWLDNPKKKNAMTVQMYHGATRVLKETAYDDSILLCVLRGKGDYFCSGTDLKNLDFSDNSTLKNYVASFIDFPKPMIAAVNGPAVGIGVTILGLCDVVYSKDTATFVTPFSSLGLCPEACSSYTFPQLMGKRKDFELLMLGKKINALDARDSYNLVTEVYSTDSFDEKVEEQISNLSKLPKLSLFFSKELIQSGDKDLLHEANNREIKRVEICKNSDDLKNAMETFSKRKK